MANNLALTITLAAVAGPAAAVLGNIKGTLQRVALATRDLNQRQHELRRTIGQFTAANLPDNAARLTAQYRRQAEMIDRLKRSQEALGRTEARIGAERAKRSELRGQMMGMAAAGFMLAQPLRVGIEFEASMSKVQALTRLDKDSEAMKALTAQARQLGAETAFTASEAAQAQGFLAMAGFKTDQILKSMPAMLNLARAGGVDLQRTADIASNIQTAYGLDASQMTRIADTLTMAFTTANVDLEMLSQTMKYVGPVAKGAGMSLEEAASMAGMLGNAGIQADMAGTALRGMLSKISGTGAKKLQALGVSTKDAAGNLRPLPVILKDLQAATANMGTADRTKALFDIFDQRAAPAVMALLDNVKDIQPYIETVRNSGGTAAKTAAIMADNMQGDFITLKSAWEDLSISLTETQNGPLRGLVQEVTGFVRGLSAWIKENSVLVGQIAKWSAMLLGLRAGFLIFNYGFSLIASGGLKIIAIFQRVRAALLIFQAAGIKAALLSLISPVGLVIAAVAAVAAAAWLIYKYWTPIKGFFSSLWNSIVAFFSGVWTRITTAFSGGIGSISALILNWSPLGLFYQAFAAVMNWFGLELPATFTGFGAQIIQGIGAGIDSAKEWLLEKIKAVADLLPDSVRSVLGIASPSRVFMELGGFSMQGLAAGLQAAASVPMDAVRNVAASVAAAGSLALAGSAAPAMAAPAADAGTGAASIVINVYAAPGMDEKALAELVARKLGDARRVETSNRRASLTDAD
jgi:TP901 family phage tail tape measure protein